MIQIRNLSSYRIGVASSYIGVQGRPLYVGLGPSDLAVIMNEELRHWGDGAKADLASYVQRGHLQVDDLTDVHVTYDLRYAPATFGAFDLPSACDTADEIRNVYNEHIASLAFHTIADVANPELTAKPATLVQLTAFIVSFQANYNAHRTQAGVHPNNDVVNVAAAPTGTLLQDIAALRELYGLFNKHRKQSVAGTTLTPVAIITY
jgi:hypothetical protein